MKDLSGKLPSSLKLLPKTKSYPAQSSVDFLLNIADDAPFKRSPMFPEPELQIAPAPNPRGKATLGNRVWIDSDGDGRQDANEAGMQGVKVKLYDQFGRMIASTVTDANGQYKFSRLGSGNYKVKFEAPQGYAFTKQNAAGDRVDSDSDASGWTDSYYLRHGQTNLSVDAGLIKKPVTELASIGDRVWFDRNGNGLQDAGEQGVAGVEVSLVRNNIWYLNGVDDSAGVQAFRAPDPVKVVTDANGRYQFDNVAAGSYHLVFNKPAGYEFTKANAGDDSRDSDVLPNGNTTSSFMVRSGEKISHFDAGLAKKTVVPQTVIGDKVWLDSNGNGLQDQGEQGLAGVKVELREYRPVMYSLVVDDRVPAREIMPDPSYANKVVATAISDQNGNYRFENIEPTIKDTGNGVMFNGQYYLQFTRPDGYSFTQQRAGNDRALDSDVSASGRTAPFALKAGDQLTAFDAGLTKNTPPKTGSIGNFVWVDSNQNGLQDANEKGMANVRVELVPERQPFSPPPGMNYVPPAPILTTTDANGHYQFDNLQAGRYSVRVSAPDGYRFTRPVEGASTRDSDVAQGGNSEWFVLRAGETNHNIDAGLVPMHSPLSGSIGDRVWLDSNANGIQDAGEQGVAGVQVWLEHNSVLRPMDGASSDQMMAPTARSVVTDANGNYKFENLAAGNYFVRFAKPNGYEFSPRDAGGDDSKDSDASSLLGMSSNIVVRAGEQVSHVDAGLVRKSVLGSIGDRVWFDTNNNGALDAGEKGAAGVRVELINYYQPPAGGNSIALYSTHYFTDTDANGNYRFDELKAGEYALKFTAPDGYQFSQRMVVPNDGFSAADPQGNTIRFKLADGEVNHKMDAGLVKTQAAGSISGKAWDDGGFRPGGVTGIQDTDERGLQAVEVVLFDGRGNLVNAVMTDANGNYRFDEVMPGEYQVKFLSPNLALAGPTAKNVGNSDLVDSDVDRSGLSDKFTLAAGQQLKNLDAGFQFGDALNPFSTLVGRTWQDWDGDGLQDMNELGQSFVEVSVFDSNHQLVAKTTSDVNGRYKIDQLKAGHYQVKFETEQAYAATKANQDASDGVDSDIDSLGVAHVDLKMGYITAVDAGFNVLKSKSALDVMIINGPPERPVSNELPKAVDLLSNDSSLDSLFGGVTPVMAPSSMLATDHMVMANLSAMVKLQQDVLL